MLTPPLPTLTRDAGARHPVPIAFPDLQAVAARSRQRADEDNRAWQLQRERMDTLIRAAADTGYTNGERVGYLAGWHWGFACGGCAVLIGTALVWLGWARLGALLAAWGLA